MNFEARNVNEAAGLQMTDEQSLTLLTDRAAVSNLVLAFARALDGKDWMTCRRCLLDEIETDYSDLRCESPARVNADDFVAKRRVALERLKTLHLSTNHQVTVEGDRATCVSAGVIHRLRPEDGERFDTYCTYTHFLVRAPAGWKIAKIKQTVHWNTGNPEVHAGAKR